MPSLMRSASECDVPQRLPPRGEGGARVGESIDPIRTKPPHRTRQRSREASDATLPSSVSPERLK